MKVRLPEQLEQSRHRSGPLASGTGDRHGAFVVICPKTNRSLRVVSGPADAEAWAAAGFSGEPWDHVSVSCQFAPPSWDQMCLVKSLFFEPDECVVQFHPPQADYVNIHPNVLHLWKPPYPVPLPPKGAV